MNEENKTVNEELDPVTEPVVEAVEEQPEEGKKGLDKKKIGIIAGAAAAVVVIVVALILIFGGNGGKDKGNDVPNSPEQNAFINELGGVSETFKGTVSEKSYDSADDAAKAFVSEELSGDGIATVNSVKSNGKLNKRKVNALNIPEDILDGSDSVEELEVEYKVDEVSAFSRGGTEKKEPSQTKTVKVYVIKYGTDWKYFTPLPVTGDTISKSYYDSVFDNEKYQNCTLEMTSEVSVNAAAEGESISMVVKATQLIKHADGKIYLEQTISSNYSGSTKETVIYAYMEETADGIDCYVKLDGESRWRKASLSTIGFKELDELTPFYDQYLDYTYFTKTNYGFELADENAKAYFNQALKGMLDEVMGAIDMNSMDVDMFAEYYVSEGVLSGMRVDANVGMTLSGDGITGTITESVTSVTKCTNYGSTVVERPNVD